MSSAMRLLLFTVVGTLIAVRTPVQAQTFSSGSDGSDGPLVVTGAPGSVFVFDPSQFHGTGVSGNIFNFTTVTISAGVTLRLTGDKLTTPVVWLVQGDVAISGVLDLSGARGHDWTLSPFSRTQAIPGPGGYAGGAGGSGGQVALPGSGPGGGTGAGTARGGKFTGNPFLLPLVGGSGGAGARHSDLSFGAGGGAGGGAILIASSGQVTVDGSIRANGGDAGAAGFGITAGCGAGGAVRLVANTIAGAGALSALAGTVNCGGERSQGLVRLEAYSISTAFSFSGTQQKSTPLLLNVITAPASARVVAVNGTPINANPAVFPDITINTSAAVDVLIETRNVPANATVTLTILNQIGAADTVIEAPPLTNCTTDNVCTTVVPVVFPFGASRGLTRVTWTQ